LRLLGKDDLHPEMNTVGGCPVHRVEPLFQLLRSKGAVEGEGVGHSASFPIRGNHEHLPDLIERLRQDKDTF